jgi:hypothetical protein
MLVALRGQPIVFRQYSEDGLSFSYPDDWGLEREESDEGWTLTLQSPGTAFALVRLDRNLPTTEDVATTALEALRDDYPKLEAETAIATMAGEMAVGHDIEFFSLDLAITAWTRCFYGPAGTVLVLCQVSDVDQEQYEGALRAFCASMRAED